MSTGMVTAVKAGGNQIVTTQKNTMSILTSTTQSGFTNVFNAVKNGMNKSVSTMQSAAQKMSSSFNGVPSNINQAMSKAIGTVNSSVNSMQKSINNVRFRFNQSMQLPHFSMSGDFDAKTKRVPTVSVRWYAKGGILTSPTIFGVQGGQLLGGGESGPEAVLPIENLKGYIMDAMKEQDSVGNYTQNVYVNSPTALNPSEVARQTRNATRQMALNMIGA